MAASSNSSKSPAKFCANCISKMEMLDIRPLGVYCSCSNCQSQTFSVCGGCKTVPYCSKACQKEHWKSNHKSRCFIFSVEKNVGAERAKRERAARMEGPQGIILRQLLKTERLVESNFWALFKSDRGMLEHDREIDEEDKKRADGSQCPYNVVAEPQGNVNGWIAEYLQYLDFLMTSVLGSV